MMSDGLTDKKSQPDDTRPDNAQPRSAKTTNPKDAVGICKAPMSVVPRGPVYEIGLGMLEGGRKYGRHNYRLSGVRASVYFDAVMRHLDSWWEGEDTDPDSGMPHIVKALCTLIVLRDAQINGLCTDDRPPKLPEDWMRRLNEKAAEIIQKYPEAEEPVTEALVAARRGQKSQA